ncbi:hypothetical protein R5R35_008177 [Gryllus longicercus]|uniref:Cytochrome c oxidase assembly factor 4 homolog, mitochondrial n=1 Tax=Gryllus longicercus TaxID=2509291 RepID=A0AAN9ZCC4_9ORTH
MQKSVDSEHVSDEDEDPVEKMLKKTGCMELHYKVQECIAETQDWRKCQNVVKEFRHCMEEYRKRTSV